ncbi:hypothetical protein M0R45_029296 [Rubus argutus]|uniref:Pectate lyase domain-containing protein n=1 Tax=Rubus argutus TaxID=59490 RepID=A0AAW1W791_RUBAR
MRTGLLDITRCRHGYTISRVSFLEHDKTMLIGADPSHVADRCIRVTITTVSLMGPDSGILVLDSHKVHLYNNYTRNWGIYAVCASVESQIYSQCNIYEAGQKKVAFKYLTEKAADKEAAMTGCIKSEGRLIYNWNASRICT